MARMIPILKVGRYKDASGRNYDITPQVLKELAETHIPNSAPLVKGHPTNDAPAMGWVEKLKIEGDKLLASFSRVSPEFAEEVEKNAFKNISASFFMPLSDSNPSKGKYCLRHIGALGASRPAIPELGTLQEALAFSEDEDSISCFSAYEDILPKENILEKMITGLLAKALKKQREEIFAEVKKIVSSANFSSENNFDKNNNSIENNNSIKNNKDTDSTDILSESAYAPSMVLGENMTEREKELETQLKKSQEETKRLQDEANKKEVSVQVKAEVEKVAKEKNLDEKTVKSLEEKATKLAETGIEAKEAVASFSEFIPDNSKQKTNHRFGNQIPSQGNGVADFSEGDKPIEDTAEFADEVAKLEKDGVGRSDAFKQAKINLSKNK